MSDAEDLNPTGRFTGLADCYARYRPSYPSEAIDCLVQDRPQSEIYRCRYRLRHRHLQPLAGGTGLARYRRRPKR